MSIGKHFQRSRMRNANWISSSILANETTKHISSFRFRKEILFGKFHYENVKCAPLFVLSN